MNNVKALNELKKLLINKYPEYIDRLILFGSRIDGTANQYSDYDILLILKKKYNWNFENKIYDTCSDINIKYDIITDIKIISNSELNSIIGKQTYIQNALNNGLVI